MSYTERSPVRKEIVVSEKRRRRPELPPEIKRTLEEKWIAENAEAVEEWNTYVAEHGLPLEKYRQF